MTSLWSAVCVVCVAVSGASGQQSVVANTRYGALKGIRTVTGPQTHVDKFLGVPYALPPVGYLRFHKPEPVLPWTGTRDATNFSAQCTSPPLPVPFDVDVAFPNSEDCLYLNVFAPQASDNGQALPVMVWIHGGAYNMGTASGLDPSPLAAKGVVVVTINYRLGVFGFLSTEDAASPGNYGLLDQIRALEWVRDTISAFNGDPNDVTIFGESAGSSSVSILTLSRSARGLFHKAIMQSGVSLSPWAMGYPHHYPEPKTIAHQTAAVVGCDMADSNHLISCLKTKNAESLLNASVEVYVKNGARIVYRPIPESTFGQYGMLSAVPDVILRNGWFNNVTTIRGFNSEESGAGLAPFVDPDDDGLTMAEFRNQTRTWLNVYLLQTEFTVDMDRIQTLLTDAYVGSSTDPFKLREAFFQMLSDLTFAAPTVRELTLGYDAHAATQYLYRFSYKSANRMNKPWLGTVHGDDIHYALGQPISNTFLWNNFVSSWTDDDKRMSDDIITMWSNFAKYGDPTPVGNGGTRWLPWRNDSPQLLDINRQPQMTDVPHASQLRLINDVITKLAEGSQGGLVG